MTESIFKPTLDEFYETQSIGSIGKAIGNNLRGFNHLQTPSALPSNQDTFGFTFFTRPQLNLRSVNIRNVRKFYDLLTQRDASIQRFVRCTLDPRLEYGTNSSKDDQNPVTSPLVDNKQAFIPLLTNSVKSISGWPELELPTFTSKEGVYKEQYIQADGINEIYNTFNLSVSFNNTKGDPIIYLFYIWTKYISYVFEGKLVPYPDFIIGNLLDYCTRIYRIVLDRTKKYVTKVLSCGIAFPVRVPLGQSFDYRDNQPYNDQNKEVTIEFKCVGCEYYDPIIPLEFNRTVEIFNPSMKCGFDGSGDPKDAGMVKVPFTIKHMFNFKGYPRINLDTNELEWYVDKNTWERIKNLYFTDVGNNSFINYGNIHNTQTGNTNV